MPRASAQPPRISRSAKSSALGNPDCGASAPRPDDALILRSHLLHATIDEPLHAAAVPLPQQPSPYFATSRRFRHVLAIDVAAAPGADPLDAAQRALAPFRYTSTLIFVLLFIAGPALTAWRGLGMAALMVLPPAYLISLVSVVLMARRASAFGLARRARWSLGFDCLACIPYAANLTKRLAWRVDGRARGPDWLARGATPEERAHVQAVLAEHHRAENTFRQMAAQVPGVIFRLRIQGKERQFTYVSPGVERLYGLRPEEVLQDPQTLERQRHPDDRDGLQTLISSARRDRQPIATEFRILTRDGQIKWVELTTAPPEDTPEGLVRMGLIIDVTERKRAEAALRDSEARWKLALECAGDGVWDWDLVTGVEVFSDRFREMYGLDAVSVPDLAAAMDERTHPDDRASMAQARADQARHQSSHEPIEAVTAGSLPTIAHHRKCASPTPMLVTTSDSRSAPGPTQRCAATTPMTPPSPSTVNATPEAFVAAAGPPSHGRHA